MLKFHFKQILKHSYAIRWAHALLCRDLGEG